MFLKSRQNKRLAWEGAPCKACSCWALQPGRQREGPRAPPHTGQQHTRGPLVGVSQPCHSPGQAAPGHPGLLNRHKKHRLKGLLWFQDATVWMRTGAALATTSQRWPTALNWRDYEKMCKKTRRYTDTEISCSQIWESFVEKSQSQLPLGLAEETPTQEERAGTEWPSWGSPSLHAGSLWLYPVRKSLTTFL